MQFYQNHVFVVACYFDGSNKMIYSCINSIRNFHPNSDIIIVDSNSPDRSYFELSKSEKISILDSKNKNYDTGAYWLAFNNCSYDYYYFLHDSIVINAPLFYTMKSKLMVLRYFPSHKQIGGFKMVKGRLDALLFGLTRFYRPKSVKSIEGFGFNNLDEIEWCKIQLDKIHTIFPQLFTSVFGPVFFCHRSVMEDLKHIGFDSILPENKLQQMCMERLFGIVLTSLNYDVCNSIQGNHFLSELDSNGIQKHILARK